MEACWFVFFLSLHGIGLWLEPSMVVVMVVEAGC